MKKLFAALASAALVGTVFAQTGMPASAAPTKGEPAQEKAQASAHKDKADVHAGTHKATAKGTHHKAKTTPDTAKPEAAKPDAAKAAAVDNTKKQ